MGSFFLFGTHHAVNAFFYEAQGLKEQFVNLVQTSDVQTVYYEHKCVFDGASHTMDGLIHKSVKDLTRENGEKLEFGHLETTESLGIIDEELGPYYSKMTTTLPNLPQVSTRLLLELYLSGFQQANWLILAFRAPELFQRLQRNLHWMKTIRHNFSKNRTCAYVVGSAHLYGEHGLINLCFNQGWNVSHADLELSPLRGHCIRPVDQIPDRARHWPLHGDLYRNHQIDNGGKPMIFKPYDIRRCPYFRECAQFLKDMGWAIEMDGLDSVYEVTPDLCSNIRWPEHLWEKWYAASIKRDVEMSCSEKN